MAFVLKTVLQAQCPPFGTRPSWVSFDPDFDKPEILDNADSFPSGANLDGTIDENDRAAWSNALHLTPARRHQMVTCPSAASTNYNLSTPAGLAGFGGTLVAFLFP